MNSIDKELTVSLTSLGAFIGALLSILSKHYGRKKILFLSGLLFAFSTLIMICSNIIYILLIARFLCGVSIGLCVTLCPVYLAESSPKNLRGRVLILYNSIVNLGQFLSTLSIALLYNTVNNWRYGILIGGIFGLLLSLGFMFLNESPIWLLKNGNKNQALLIYQKIQPHNNGLILYKEALKDIADEQEQQAVVVSGLGLEEEEEEQHKLSALSPQQQQQQTTNDMNLYDIFHDKLILKMLSIGIGFQILQQFSGINTIIY